MEEVRPPLVSIEPDPYSNKESQFFASLDLNVSNNDSKVLDKTQCDAGAGGPARENLGCVTLNVQMQNLDLNEKYHLTIRPANSDTNPLFKVLNSERVGKFMGCFSPRQKGRRSHNTVVHEFELDPKNRTVERLYSNLSHSMERADSEDLLEDFTSSSFVESERIVDSSVYQEIGPQYHVVEAARVQIVEVGRAGVKLLNKAPLVRAFSNHFEQSLAACRVVGQEEDLVPMKTVDAVTSTTIPVVSPSAVEPTKVKVSNTSKHEWCENCNVQTHKRFLRFLKRPVNNAAVRNGMCLACNASNKSDSIPSLSSIITQGTVVSLQASHLEATHKDTEKPESRERIATADVVVEPVLNVSRKRSLTDYTKVKTALNMDQVGADLYKPQRHGNFKSGNLDGDISVDNFETHDVNTFSEKCSRKQWEFESHPEFYKNENGGSEPDPRPHNRVLDLIKSGSFEYQRQDLYDRGMEKRTDVFALSSTRQNPVVSIEEVKALLPEHDNFKQDFATLENFSYFRDLRPAISRCSSLYFVPSLMRCNEFSKKFRFSFKSDSIWKHSLCNSWRFKYGLSLAGMEKVQESLLRSILRECDTSTNPTNQNDSLKVHNINCWRNGFTCTFRFTPAKCRATYEVELAVILMSRDSEICVGRSSLVDEGSNRLAVIAKGIMNWDDASIVWNGGYNMFITAVQETLSNMNVEGYTEEIVCPKCLHFLPNVDEASFLGKDCLDLALESSVLCENHHDVNPTIVRYKSPSSLCSSNCINGSFCDDGRKQKQESLVSFDHIKGAVFSSTVLVCLWDGETICNRGSGFVVDRKEGLIVTAAHNVIDIENGRCDRYYRKTKTRGTRRPRVLIANYCNNLNQVVYKYWARIADNTEEEFDSNFKRDCCILRVESEIKDGGTSDIHNLMNISERIWEGGANGHSIMDCSELRLSSKLPEEYSTIFIIGFRSSVNIDVSQGKVREIDCKSSYIVAHCRTLPGYSGGPVVNSKGEAVGLLQLSHEGGLQCYAVTSSFIAELIEKSKKDVRVDICVPPSFNRPRRGHNVVKY